MKKQEEETAKTDFQNRENRLYAEKVGALHRQIPSGIFPSFLSALLYGMIVWKVLPHSHIITWLLMQLAVLGGRFYLYWHYKRMPHEITRLRRWKTQFTLMTYLASAIWGAACIFLFPENAPRLQFILVFLIGGLASASVGLYPIFSEIVSGMITLLLSPLIFQFLVFQSDDASRWTALYAAIYGASMIATARKIQGSVTRSLELAEDLRVEVKERQRAESALKMAHDVLDLRVRERTAELSKVNDQLRKLTNAIEQSIEMVVITDLDGKIEYVNPMAEKTSGYEASELISKPLHHFQRNGKGETKLEDIFKIIRTGDDWQGEVVNEKKSGISYITDMTMNPIYNDHGEITHCVAIMRDVSDRKRLEQNLLQASKLSSLGTLTSGIAHELNTPLATILGFSEEIENNKDIPRQVKFQTQWIMQESKRCIGIVRNLLKFSRKHKPRTEIFNVNEAILTVLTLYNYQLKSDLIDVETALHEAPLFVLGDSEQIQQVMLNILLNAHSAIESTAKKGLVKIIGHRREKALSIIIENNGPPIPEDHLQKIFDPFFTNKKIGEGTGLGLSVSYGIIEEHGGRIRVENIGAEGVRFLITLPLSEEQTEEGDGEDDIVLPQGLRILIVEDDDKFRHWLDLFLTRQGAITTKVTNGLEAIDQIKKSEFDVIISDLKMPVMGGVDLCRWIEKHRPDDVKKFMFLSGVMMIEVVDFCADNKIPFLVKPIPKKELLMTLKRVWEAVRGK